MKRTTEKALGITSIIINVVSANFLTFFFLFLLGIISPSSNTDYDNYFEESDSAVIVFVIFFGVLMVFSFIAIILSIIAVIFVDTKTKNSGIMFLISSFFSGIISIQGILLLIVGIRALVKNPNSNQLIERVTTTPIENNPN